MAVESAADIDAMLADWDVATIGAAEVDGIFSHGYIDVLGMEAEGPSFLCAAADVAAVSRGTAVSLGGVSYTVVGRQRVRDGALMLLKLEEA